MKYISKFVSLPLGVKSSVIYILSSLLSQALSFISLPLFTRLLDESDYGIISLFTSWSSILGVFAMLALTSGAFNIGMLEFKNDRDSYISSLLVLSNVATLFVFICCCSIYSYSNIFDLPKSLICLMFLNFIFNPAKDFWLLRNRYELHYKTPFIIIVSSSVIALIFSYICVKSFNLNLGVIKLWSAGIITLSVSIYFYIRQLRKGLSLIRIKYIKYALFLNLPLIIHTLSKNVMDGSDKIMIAKMLSLEDAGKFSVVANLAIISGVIWSAINGSLIPYMFEKLSNKDYFSINTTIRPLLVIYALICVVISYIAPEILFILAPPKYYDTIYIVPPICAGVFFTSLYNIFGNIELYFKKTKLIMFATLITASFNVIMNWITIPYFGYIAPAYTTLLSLILFSFIHYLFLIYIKAQKIIQIKYIVYLSLIVVLFCLSANILYSYVYFRYAMTLILITALLLYLKKTFISYNNSKNE